MIYASIINSQFPKAKTVKAFNYVYYQVFAEKAFLEGDERIAVQICSDDEQAKETVKQLIQDIGFAPQDLGGLNKGVLFEPNAPLYNKNLKIDEGQWKVGSRQWYPINEFRGFKQGHIFSCA